MSKRIKIKVRPKKRKPYTPPYTKLELRRIWNKGRIVPGREPSKWREDYYGNLIRFNRYGDRDSVVSWEVDHIVRIADGGKNVLSNLRPLQWEANVERG